jgi:hypothetical protein
MEFEVTHFTINKKSSTIFTLEAGIQYLIKHKERFAQYYHMMKIFVFLDLTHHHSIALWLKLWGH